MSKTITVKGTGRVSAKPDYVVISMSLSSQDMEYDKAMELAANELKQLKSALHGAGFEEKALKTSNFNVRTDYVNLKDADGNYRNKFNGYVVLHSIKLGFDLDTAKLSKALSAVSECLSNPELSIKFTVRDESAVNEEMLRLASQNARRKAEILCDASGVELGALLSVDYNCGKSDLASATNYRMAAECMKMSELSRGVDIEPDDIEISDTVTFVWEIK